MSLLIDGYNLLHASGIVGRGRGPGFLERSRLALVEMLVASVDPSQLGRTTVVFDAANAPPGLPNVIQQSGIIIRFARGYNDADELIEELIQADSAPRSLTVVSSDHRLHRAARRRKARAIDSDRWLVELFQARRERQRPTSATAVSKPIPMLTEAELHEWLAAFTTEDVENSADAESRPASNDPASNHPASNHPASNHADAIDADSIDSVFNPFPPGYAEDITEDDV